MWEFVSGISGLFSTEDIHAMYIVTCWVLQSFFPGHGVQIYWKQNSIRMNLPLSLARTLLAVFLMSAIMSSRSCFISADNNEGVRNGLAKKVEKKNFTVISLWCWEDGAVFAFNFFDISLYLVDAVADVLNFGKKLIHFPVSHINSHVFCTPDIVIVALSLMKLYIRCTISCALATSEWYLAAHA